MLPRQMADDLTHSDDGPAQTVRLGIAQAATQLGVSPDTIRRRVKRGQLEAIRDNTGKLWISLPADPAKAGARVPRQPAAYAPTREDQVELVQELRSHIASLRSELERSHQERDKLLSMLGEAQEALARRDQSLFEKLWNRLFGAGG